MGLVKKAAFGAALLAGVSFAAVSPVAAQEAGAAAKVDYSAMPDAQLGQALMGQVKLLEEGKGQADFCVVEGAAKEMSKRRADIAAELHSMAMLGQMECAAAADRYKDAYTAMVALEAEKTGPYGMYGAWIALKAEAYDDAARRMEQEVSAPTAFKDDYDQRMFWQFSREMRDKKQGALADGVIAKTASSPALVNATPGFREGIAGEQLRIAVEAKDYVGARKMIPNIHSHATVMGWLADKEFEPLWPDLEAAAGPGMATLRNADVDRKLAIFHKDVNNHNALNEAVHALYYAERYEDAVKLARTIDHTDAGLAKADEDQLWAMNVEAYALDQLKRSAEADALFDRMVKAQYKGADSENGLINFAINRGSRLVEFGQFQKGYDAMVEAEKIPGSPYAEMLILRGKVCALSKLGRGSEAAAMLAEIGKRTKDAPTIAANAYLCAGDADKAAASVIAGLEDEVMRTDILMRFQPQAFDYMYYKDSVLPNTFEALHKRPDVAAAVAKYGRTLPDALIPLKPENR